MLGEDRTPGAENLNLDDAAPLAPFVVSQVAAIFVIAAIGCLGRRPILVIVMALSVMLLCQRSQRKREHEAEHRKANQCVTHLVPPFVRNMRHHDAK